MWCQVSVTTYKLYSTRPLSRLLFPSNTRHSDGVWRGELLVIILPVQIGLVATAAVSERLSDLMQVPEKMFELLKHHFTLNLQIHLPDILLLQTVDIFSVQTLLDQQRIKLFQSLFCLKHPERIIIYCR